MVICLERGADLYIAQLMPLLLTVSCFSKIQIGLSLLVPVARVCVCTGRMAAVWPLVGIVLEACVLCVIIVVHERRRRRERALSAAQDTDNDAADNSQLIAQTA